MSEKLQIGDVISIEKGMKVYTSLEYQYVYSNVNSKSKNAHNLTHYSEIKVGDKLKYDFDTSIYEGEYVVINTAMTGGGTGHGPYDVYPDGWQVIAKKLNNGVYDNEGLGIRFYQSGSFTIVIKPEQIQPIRKMKMTFV